jgi:peptide/nickel transport system permease protein
VAIDTQSSTISRVSGRNAARRQAFRFVVGRIVYLLVVLIAVTFLTAFLVNLLPGDPARAILGENATADQVKAVRLQLHLDQPIWERYLRWAGNALHGDLGISYRSNQPVTSSIRSRFAVSVELMILGQIVAIGFALALGSFAAFKARRWPDKLITGISFAFISAPSFVVGLVLVFVFAVQLRMLPATGFVPLSDGLWPNLKSLLLPMIAVSAESAAIYQRLLRADMVRTLREDFILAATAKGMSTTNILFRQALRPSSYSLVTLAGINTARMIGGLVIIETLFALPGMGRLLVDSINSRDFVTIQGLVALIAVAYVVINLLVDLLYLALDPRVRNAGN